MSHDDERPLDLTAIDGDEEIRGAVEGIGYVDSGNVPSVRANEGHAIALELNRVDPEVVGRGLRSVLGERGHGDNAVVVENAAPRLKDYRIANVGEEVIPSLTESLVSDVLGSHAHD